MGVPVPEIVREGRSRYAREGRRGLDWTWDRATKREREAVDEWIVKTKHPLGFEPGTPEQRFRALAMGHDVERDRRRGSVRGTKLITHRDPGKIGCFRVKRHARD